MQAIPVSTLVRAVRLWLEQSEQFSDAWVVGEVSNYSRSSLGHQYFTLRDTLSGMRMVLFRGDDRGTPIANGDSLFVHGRVTVYEQRGELQFVCDFVQPEGLGLQAAQFEELRARLERDGLFDPARKRPLPRFPQRIGLVTSPKGAALQDIRNVLARRWPLAEVVFSPAIVQGDFAPQQIARAIERLRGQPLDLMILARGGGSAEDLAAFNDEAVARAVFAFPAPVVTGVGHDTDVSIVDYVADVHAPTPSAAAERATPNSRDVAERVAAVERTMADCSRRMIAELGESVRDELETVRRRLPEPAMLMRTVQATVNAMRRESGVTLEQSRSRFEGCDGRLATLNPLATLGRGYAIVHDAKTRKVISSTRRIKAGQRLSIAVQDGAFSGEVS